MTNLMSISHRNEVVATRRGYTLLGLGLLIPGSAQAIAGPKKLGRFGLKVWISLVLLLILGIVLTLFFRNFMVGVITNPVFLKFASIAVFAVGFFWVGLTILTWWSARPARMGAIKGLVFSVIALILILALTFGTIWLGQSAWATGGALGNIFNGGGDSDTKQGRYNILLLGSDSGPGRSGVRPDSITVVSVSAETGRAVLISLPRNLEDVPFPRSSPLQALYPNGYGCDTAECLLNAIYMLGVEHADLYPDADDPGIQAMIEGVSGATGLEINYYAMINMEGFAALIDAIGGLTITILKRVPAEYGNKALEPGPDQHLNGKQTLWFARERHSGSDYDRMQRQKCVLAATLAQINPTLVATKFTDIAAASGEMAKTSVPSSQIGALADLALKAKKLPISSLSFTPPLINPGRPDFELIHQMVKDAIAGSEILDEQAKTPSTPAPSKSKSPKPAPSTEGPTKTKPTQDQPTENVTDDLDKVCSVG